MATRDREKKVARIDKIREIVREDFERIQRAAGPHEVLSVPTDATLEQVEERYLRYERFYRAENFQRLGDLELTRKALNIRRAIARAIAEVRDIHQSRLQPEDASSEKVHDANLFTPDEDRLALAKIYLRDGLTYLQLGDLNEAYSMLRCSIEYDTTYGIAYAYLGYVGHKRRTFDPQVVQESRALLERATELSPDDPDVYVLQGRFLAKLSDDNGLESVIAQIERINPAHPMLDKLQRKLRTLRG